MSRQKVILLPTDLSPRSTYALEIARSLAREQGARLDLLHVVPMAASADARRVAEQALANIVESNADIAMRWTLLAGDVAENILWMAREFRPDLIVVAGRKRNRLAALVSASVSRDVARRSPCPVVRLNLPAQWPLQSAPAARGRASSVGFPALALSRVRRPRATAAPRCESCERLFGKNTPLQSHRERILS
jgi:nucleotide-binding universal stress UspA family protein